MITHRVTITVVVDSPDDHTNLTHGALLDLILGGDGFVTWHAGHKGEHTITVIDSRFDEDTE